MSVVDPADEALLVQLGSIAAAVDPPPPLLSELGRAAFEMRRLDAELAALVDDSADELAGVRATAPETRLLSFEGTEVCVELQISVSVGSVALVGQVVPAPEGTGAVVRLETADGAARSTSLDAVGGFRFDAAPASLLRLHVELPGAVSVTTTWVRP